MRQLLTLVNSSNNSLLPHGIFFAKRFFNKPTPLGNEVGKT